AAGILLFGRQYPLEPRWVLLFSAAAALMIVHGAAAALFAARDLSGLRVAVAGQLLAGLANAALAAWLCPSLGITGAAAALVLGYPGGLVVFLGRSRKA